MGGTKPTKCEKDIYGGDAAGICAYHIYIYICIYICIYIYIPYTYIQAADDSTWLRLVQPVWG